VQVFSDREEEKKKKKKKKEPPAPALLPFPEGMKRMGGDSRTSTTDLETIKATSNHRIGSIGSGSGSNGIITGGPIYRLCAQQLKPPSGKMGITGLRCQILGTKPFTTLASHSSSMLKCYLLPCPTYHRTSLHMLISSPFLSSQRRRAYATQERG